MKIGLAILCLVFLIVGPASGQSQSGLPKPGEFAASHGDCPSCQPGEWAVTVEKMVSHGDYVYVEDPPCSQDVQSQLDQLGRQLVDSQIPGISSVVGPVIDVASDQARAFVSNNIRGFVGQMFSKYTGAGSECQIVSVIIPGDAAIVGKTLLVGDGDRGVGDCDESQGGQYPCYFDGIHDQAHEVGCSKWLEPERR
jgi:hypothetical protein